MTNKFKHIAMMLFVAGAMIMATSCSKDNSGSSSSSIKGWYFTQPKSHSDWIPQTTVKDRGFIHIKTDNYLEWGWAADHTIGDYNTPLTGHSGWYTDGSPIGKNFVRNGDLIVCENGWTISIDGNRLYFDGDTYYKE